MKKFLSLVLVLAVAVSASAGVNITRNYNFNSKSIGTATSKIFKTSHALDGANASGIFRAPVTEAPEGEVKVYKRTGDCLYVEDGYVQSGVQEGSIELIYAADNKVWFKNIFFGVADQYGDSYVYGTLSADGATITVPMGQSIYYSSSYDADVVLSWGTSSVGSNIVWTPDESVTEAVYVIDGNTITLQGGGPAPSGSDYPQYEANGLGSVWTDDGTFGGYLEWGTVLTEFIPATLPTNLAVEPTTTTAHVTWDGAEGENWNLRWRPWTDLSGNPYMWDFDLENLDADLEGWWTYDADGDGQGWGLAYTDDAQTDACLISGSYTSSGACSPDNYIGTPNVPLNGKLQFTMWGRSAYYPEVIQVYAMVGEEMYQLFEDSLVTTTTHEVYTVDLAQFDGAEGCIVFRNYSTYDQYSVYIDDVMIGDLDNIIEPAEWNYVYDLNVTESDIEGLTPETKYEVQVMALKDDDETDWTESVEFTTLAEQVPEPVITLDTEFGAYTGAQTIHVSVENIPEGGSIKYQFVSATTESSVQRRAPGDEWIDYDENTGITIDNSGTLTVAVFDGEGEILAQISGDFSIDTITGVEDIAASTVDNTWYNMSGIKFNGKPSAPGIYINKGRKVVVK